MTMLTFLIAFKFQRSNLFVTTSIIDGDICAISKLLNPSRMTSVKYCQNKTHYLRELTKDDLIRLDHIRRGSTQQVIIELN